MPGLCLFFYDIIGWAWHDLIFVHSYLFKGRIKILCNNQMAWREGDVIRLWRWRVVMAIDGCV